jgi:hypothetical protein
MTFWKQSRGDHILTAMIVSAFIFSYIIGLAVFGNNAFGLLFFFCGSLFGILFPIPFIPMEWINNELPKHHFWRDLLT